LQQRQKFNMPAQSLIIQKILRAGLVLAAAWGLAFSASASFPDKPVRLVVPFPAGGAADIMARGLAHHLSATWKQPVIIDNKGGAGGTLAAETVAKAPADGYTLLFATMGTMTINPALYAKLRYDPVNDFAPVALTHITPRVLVVGQSLNVNTVSELIERARKTPGRITYGSAGNGSSSHLSGALFERMAEVDMVHVPYKGSAPLLSDVLAGRIDTTFDSYTVYEEHIKSGRVRALAVTSRVRMGALPHIPTMEEAGLAGYEVSNWLGVFAPASTPPSVIQALHAGVVKAMSDADLKRQLTGLGIEPKLSTPAELGELVRSDLRKWARLVKASGAQVE
jgi:tripartite-type tricarboxylate transporter receptor subunit TctC